METDAIQLTLPLPPSANRYWRIWSGRVIVSRAARAYKKAVGDHCRSLDLKPIDGQVAVQVDVYRARRSGDLDNWLKVSLDSITGYAYRDDSQIVEINARRFDDKENPRLEVTVKQAPHEQNQN